jgi:transcriptional regulator with XRE-family HTH domain
MVKTLTQWQGKKAVARAQKGWSQERIALSLKVSKERVGIALRKAKVGKRRESPFWSSVKRTQEDLGMSWKEARETVFKSPKWRQKRAERHGKTKWREWKEFWDSEYVQGLSEEELKQYIEEEMEDTYFESA